MTDGPLEGFSDNTPTDMDAQLSELVDHYEAKGLVDSLVVVEPLLRRAFDAAKRQGLVPPDFSHTSITLDRLRAASRVNDEVGNFSWHLSTIINTGVTISDISVAPVMDDELEAIITDLKGYCVGYVLAEEQDPAWLPVIESVLGELPLPADPLARDLKVAELIDMAKGDGIGHDYYDYEELIQVTLGMLREQYAESDNLRPFAQKLIQLANAIGEKSDEEITNDMAILYERQSLRDMAEIAGISDEYIVVILDSLTRYLDGER